jgi:hypothetical protein
MTTQSQTQTQSQNPDLQQLTATVAALAEALALGERRHERMARSLRRVGLILVALAVGASALLASRPEVALAAQTGLPQANDAVAALNNISNNLAVLGMVGDTLRQTVPAIQKAMMENPDVQKSVQVYVKAQGLPVTQENLMAYAAPAIFHSAATTMVDAVVLMQRIRDDSNRFRDLVGGPTQALHGMERELAQLNMALASVPAMAMQMDLMNRNMASMTHSIGSTMGRMGSWMP